MWVNRSPVRICVGQPLTWDYGGLGEWESDTMGELIGHHLAIVVAIQRPAQIRNKLKIDVEKLGGAMWIADNGS